MIKVVTFKSPSISVGPSIVKIEVEILSGEYHPVEVQIKVAGSGLVLLQEGRGSCSVGEFRGYV